MQASFFQYTKPLFIPQQQYLVFQHVTTFKGDLAVTGFQVRVQLRRLHHAFSSGTMSMMMRSAMNAYEIKIFFLFHAVVLLTCALVAGIRR